jgi:hypothetical protein
MDKQELEALDKLLAYVWDEEKDFKTYPIEQHIYRSIYVLMRYRGWDMSKRVDPEKVGVA